MIYYSGKQGRQNQHEQFNVIFKDEILTLEYINVNFFLFK